MQNETVIQLSDLERIEIVCQHCHATYTFAVSNDGPFPTRCIGCEQPLAVGIVNIWNVWKDFLYKAEKAKIQFRLKGTLQASKEETATH